MADYPDYTQIFQLIGTDIMVPIDIQGSYIMLPVDIQAQFANLNIDIVAQTIGNIDVNLAAQSIDKIEVDITAQTITNLDIEIVAQNIGIYLQPGWAALKGTDMNDSGEGWCDQANWVLLITYPVPLLKTLYITQIGFTHTYILAGTLGVSAALEIDGEIVHVCGGNTGGSIILSKPIVANGGSVVEVSLKNNGDDATYGYASIGGYQV